MIEGFHHVVIFCSDTEASRAWYGRVGFRYLRGYEGMHWFALGDAEIMLHPGGRRGRDSKPNLHVSVRDAAAELARLNAVGIEAFDHQDPAGPITEPVTRPWGDVEFEIYDPDGQIWVFTETG
ncbi:MAG TPA: VOC family protein [Trueperaceae bacterium]